MIGMNNATDMIVLDCGDSVKSRRLGWAGWVSEALCSATIQPQPHRALTRKHDPDRSQKYGECPYYPIIC